MKSIFKSHKTSITSAAILLAVAALGSRLLGLVRDRILAGRFGAGDELDVYFAAFRVPDLIYNIVIAGAVSAAFIPVFIAVYSKNKEEAWKLASNFLNIALGVLIIFSALFAIFAPVIMPFVAPGFDEEKTALAVTSTRIMFLSPIFFGMSAVLSGILHSFKRFLAYSIAPIFYNAGIIFGAMFLVEPFGVQGLAWGVALGAFLHFLVQVPHAVMTGFSLKFIIDFRDKNLRKIFSLLAPRALGLAAFQVNLLVITAIASTLATGSIAIFNLANNLQFIPIGIIGLSFATAALPSLSESVTLKNRESFVRELAKIVRLIFFIVFPISILMFILRAQIVRIALGSGEFAWLDTQLTAAALGIFCIGIFAHSLVPIFSRAFYAVQNTKTPVVVSIMAMAVNVVLSFLFVYLALEESYAVTAFKEFLDLENIDNIELLGLPLAFAIAGIFNFTALFYILSKKYADTFLVSSIYSAVTKISFSSIIAGLTAYGMLYLVEPFLNTETFIGIFVQAGVASVAGGAVYLFCMYILKSDELYSLMDILKRKLNA